MTYTIKKGLAYRRVDGEVFIVDAARSELRELNGTASAAWEGLAAGRGEAEIASRIAAEFEVDERTARADLRGFIKELAAAGLVEAVK